MHRRAFLATGCATLALAALTRPAETATDASYVTVKRTDAEWRALLSDAEYKVLRREGTERAFSSPLDKEYRPGTYLCRGCDLPLYPSSTKYDSGTGWPSFWDSLPNAVRTKPDRKLLRVRTEVHCRQCGSHLGHVFDDGPPPTGKRHCLNGVALRFVAG